MSVPSRRIAVTGASGFVGRQVVAALRQRGHTVIALGRHTSALRHTGVADVRHFDPNDGTGNAAAFAGADAVIHLAGESVAGRWTAEKKRAISTSRIEGTRAVIASLRALEQRPSVLVCASASGYYGNRGDEPLTEASLPGSSFLARVCADWEREAHAAEALGIRVVCLRTGVALGNGGALGSMVAPFHLGAGGPLGSGRQFFPWIHVDDLASLYAFAVERDDVRGAVNAVTPDYATSARFAQALGAALRRPAVTPAPAPALHLLLGEFASALLEGQLIVPAVALDEGFSWRFPLLEDALIDLVGGPGSWRVLRDVRRDEIVRANPEEVFTFFSDARNLGKITPPDLRFSLERAPGDMRRGTILDYRLRVRGFPLRWRTLITEWNPPHGFADVQLHGPYALWRHTHRFVSVHGGVRMSDEVTYALPFAPFSAVAEGTVRHDVTRIFDYRSEAIAQLLSIAPRAVAATSA